MAASYFLTGNSEIETVVDKSFYSSPGVVDTFNIGLEATNGLGVMAKNVVFLKLNQQPTGGSCTVSPSEGTSLLTEFEVDCDGWVDPEDIGIKQYVISSKDII